MTLSSGDNRPASALSRIVNRVRQWGGRDIYNITLGFTVAFVFGLGFAGFTTPGSNLAVSLLDSIRSIPAGNIERKADSITEEYPPTGSPEGEQQHPQEPGFLDWWLVIVKQNLRVALIAAAGGMLARFIPWGVALLNGVGLGMCLIAIKTTDGLDPLQLFLFIAPHGIIEIPAILLASIVGVRLHRVALPPTLGGRWKAFLTSWRIMLLVCVMLLTAGAIEVW